VGGGLPIGRIAASGQPGAGGRAERDRVAGAGTRDAADCAEYRDFDADDDSAVLVDYDSQQSHNQHQWVDAVDANDANAANAANAADDAANDAADDADLYFDNDRSVADRAFTDRSVIDTDMHPAVNIGELELELEINHDRGHHQDHGHDHGVAFAIMAQSVVVGRCGY
jgi:hypothetical protein